jgi:Predicted nucleotide-binding protein containing TIR-like domain
MKPRIFLASSVEGKPIAEALQANLEYEASPTVWDQAFTLSTGTIDKLLTYCTDNDFAVFIFSEDDVAKIRGSESSIPRDNVVFECGMFMGMHGKDSTFVVVPRKAPNLHMPTDLLGYVPATYDAERAKSRAEARAALGSAATEIKTAIEGSSWKKVKPVIEATSRPYRGLKYPLKLWFEITNSNHDPLAIESISFTLGATLKLATNAKKVPGAPRKYKLPYRYLITTGSDSKHPEEHFSTCCVIPPGETFKSYVPIDSRRRRCNS